ncbi:hypothetical protein L2E82_26968 [Cichorium intybus]|uniref:Uncharacterized protein n=1 Tax=Cichorium intybus TaxID=13427 RepID=A0ACB9CSB6_CICIN|nr:hypothetical protein L2E82_26968 [Cichorium intybus]
MSLENYDPCFPDQPVIDQYLPVWANLPSFRSKPAFVWVDDGSPGLSERSSLTYEELNYSVQSISSQLLLSLQRGDTVIILCSPGLQLVEILFGCQRAGLLAVPIFPPNPTFSKNDHHHLIRVLLQTRPNFAIANGPYVKSVREYIKSSQRENPVAHLLKNLKWISTDNFRVEKNVSSKKNLHSSYTGCNPDEVYLIQYTSGTTGIPKPVLVTAGSAAHNVRAARKSYDLHPNSIITSWLPQYHDCGFMFLLLTIVSGATCVLTSPNAFIKRPRLWLELISDFKATCTPVPSFTLPLVIRRGGVEKGTLPINLTTMKNLVLINEPIYHETVEEFVERFKPFGLNPSAISPSYGLAENCTFVSTSWRQRCSHTFPTYKKLLPSARLVTSETKADEEPIEILIVNEDSHELVKDGTEGEIWVSSPSNASGYLGHPSLTQQVFQSRVKRPFCHKFYVRTGDRGVVIGTERFLFVTGRCSDVITIKNGEEIHPHYLETSAYDSCRRFLRGGCIAAFRIARNTVAIVAEMQRSDWKDEVFLKRICDGIRGMVKKDERIDVGLVALVKSGEIPKTTSGKIQRTVAKDRFLGGKMNVLMEMRFSDEEELGFKKSFGKNQSKGKIKVLESVLSSL